MEELQSSRVRWSSDFSTFSGAVIEILHVLLQQQFLHHDEVYFDVAHF